MKAKITAVLLFTLLISSVTTPASAYQFNPGASISLTEEYNSNIFLMRTEKTGDFITHVSPAANLSLKSEDAEINADYSPSFSYYRSHEELNDTSQRASAHGLLRLSGNTKLSVDEAYVRSRELRDLATILDQGSLRELVKSEQNTVSGTLTYTPAEPFSVRLSAAYSDLAFEKAELNDTRTYSGIANLSFKADERTELSLTAGLSQFDYRQGANAYTQDYSLGVTRRITPTITVGVSGGAIVTGTEGSGKKDVDFSGGFNITKRFEKASANLTYRHTVVSGGEEGEPLGSHEISFSLTAPLTESLTGSAFASYNSLKSVRTGASDLDTVRLGATISYSINRWADLTLLYNHIELNDNVNRNRSYDNHVAALTLRLHYERRTEARDERTGGGDLAP